MGNYAHLPSPFGRPSKNACSLLDYSGIKRARKFALFNMLAVSADNPALRYRISSDFHESIIEYNALVSDLLRAGDGPK